MPSPIKPTIDGRRQCSRCNQSKVVSDDPAISEFYASKTRHSGFRSQCKACENAANTERLKDPHFRDRQRLRIKRWKADNRDRDREHSRAFRQRNLEEQRERELLKERSRRVRKLCSGETISPEQWKAILSIFGNTCAYCRKSPPTDMDHFLPLAKGGLHTVSNVVPACDFCNSSKKDRDPFDWMEAKGIDGDFVVAMICETRHIAA